MPAWRKVSISARSCSTWKARSGQAVDLTKILALFLLLAMVAHIIKPLGLPGLKKRADFWKIAIIAFVVMSFVIVLQVG